MSAAHVGTDGEEDAQGLAVYRFRLDKGVPPYLIALAIGDLAFRPIGPLTGVYAEPSVVDTAANEFVKSIDDRRGREATAPTGGRYDISCCRRRSVRRHENPTQTLRRPPLAGDRSLVSSSRTSWRTPGRAICDQRHLNDFWLNEGFTTYIESHHGGAARQALR